MFLADFPYFERIEVRLWDHLALCVYRPPINFWIPEPIFIKFGMYIMAPEHISKAYFIVPPISLCVCMCIPYVVVRQRPDRHVTCSRGNEELLEASSLYGPCCTKKEFMGLSVCPPMVVKRRLGKRVAAATKICWRRLFLCGLCGTKEEFIGLSVYPPMVSKQRLGKHVPPSK
jgi:hypothetical protein